MAKRPLAAGTLIAEALGGFELRGEALQIAGNEDALPITVLDGARTRRAIAPGEILRAADVEVPETLALALYREALAPLAPEARPAHARAV